MRIAAFQSTFNMAVPRLSKGPRRPPGRTFYARRYSVARAALDMMRIFSCVPSPYGAIRPDSIPRYLNASYRSRREDAGLGRRCGDLVRSRDAVVASVGSGTSAVLGRLLRHPGAR